MEQKLLVKYINTQLNLAIVDIKNVYLLTSDPERLVPEVYRGKLVMEKGYISKI